MNTSKDFDFESVFKTFYQPIEDVHSKLSATTLIIPSQELQDKKIRELAQIPCLFGVIVEVDIDQIKPIPNVPFPFKADTINNKQFCKHIHPSYLVPFLIFAKFAYEVARRADIKPEQLLVANYRIPIPMKLSYNHEYAWYIQKGYVLSINQNNQLVSHLNLYDFDRMCLTLANGEIENRFVEASALVDNNLNEIFQGYLREEIHKYLVDIFQKQYKQWKILELLKSDLEQSNHSLAQSLKLSEETVKSYSKDILQKLKANLGYQFVTLREAVASLSYKKYI